jgi:hypothetical protein
MSQVSYHSERVQKKRVYYTGDDILREGYCLCYDRDSVTGGSAGEANVNRALHVEKPAAGNLRYFAGLVSAEDAGKAGPCWVTVIEPASSPGRLASVYAAVDCTLGATRLAVAADSYAAVAAASDNVPVGLAMQTVNRSVTPGLVLAQLEAPATAHDAAASVAQSQSAVTAPTGSTTGGTFSMQSEALTAPTGATTGGTLAMYDVTAVGGTCGGTAGQYIENNFAQLAAQLEKVRGDLAILAAAVNAARTDVGGILTALQDANLMAS